MERGWILLSLAISLAMAFGGGCWDPSASTVPTPSASGQHPDDTAACDDAVDADGDGHRCAVDCDDRDDERFPGAPEVCDGTDNDCDGGTDEEGPTPWWEDGDGDGYGGGPSERTCSPQTGWVSRGGDCDDADDEIHPGAAERCDGAIDNDCDGVAASASPWHVDGDGDGYGGGTAYLLCNPQDPRYVERGGDCDDADPTIHPTEEEGPLTDVCDGRDNDCDGAADEEGPTDWYEDRDGDRHGAGPAMTTCAPLPGWVPLAGDCDDGRADVYPGAPEICDGLDNDCDGLIDPGGETLFYLDLDGDGFGGEIHLSACYLSDPAWITRGGDCDDSDPTVHPDAWEPCDGLDNDCDSTVDEAGRSSYWPDDDSDTWGRTGGAIVACEPGAGWVPRDGDCDDGDPSAWPGALEVCNLDDDDCDGAVDETAEKTFYQDTDGDGVGGAPLETCPSAGLGSSLLPGDCDDGDPNVYPGAVEACDGINTNCSAVDDEPLLTRYFIDGDQDLWGGPLYEDGCDASLGVTRPGDCDDGNTEVHPGQTEQCGDGVDADCDLGTSDLCSGTEPCEDSGLCPETPAPTPGHPVDPTPGLPVDPTPGLPVDPTPGLPVDPTPGLPGTPTRSPALCPDGGMPALYWWDADRDGYGREGAVEACPPPDPRWVQVADDCDDGDADTHPDAQERCDGIDNDCDGATDEEGPTPVWLDADGDTFGAGDPFYGCATAHGLAPRGGDCDDASPEVSPDAVEICDGQDNDCDGIVDGTGAALWHVDADGDGFGVSDGGQVCAPPDSSLPWVQNGDDCDDADPAIHPAATEVCDGIDSSCNGDIDEPTETLFYPDADGDGFGGGQPVAGCEIPPGYVPDPGDCDDGDPSTSIGATEICGDGIDQDCDAQVDEGSCAPPPPGPCAEGEAPVFLYFDGDEDGYGAYGKTVCSGGDLHWVDQGGDCMDSDPAIHPGALDTCEDHVDDDCSGAADEGCDLWLSSDQDGDTYPLSEDCDDRDPAVWPGADERCNRADDDCDGGADEGLSAEACPVGESTDADEDGYDRGEDCDDGDATVHPGADEQCDRIDEDCDGQADEGLLYVCDADGDGHTSEAGDCDDGDPQVHPGAAEQCDQKDNDCDLQSDEGCDPWHQSDGDADGFPLSVDCDDTDPHTHPQGWEACDGQDQDCDGLADEGLGASCPSDSADEDGDGVAPPVDCDDDDPEAGPDGAESCDRQDEDCDGRADEGLGDCDPDGDQWPEDQGDCAPEDPSVYPGAPEACDGEDEDCDGFIDEGALDCDGDGDGYAPSDGDCDDTRADAFPGAEEDCDGQDQDCDGRADEGLDGEALVPLGDGDGDGQEVGEGDCDDADPQVFAGAEERCDGRDEDCDGLADEDAPGCSPAGDGDGDGVPVDLDCDDTDASVHPLADERCVDHADSDCDGVVDEDAGAAPLCLLAPTQTPPGACPAVGDADFDGDGVTGHGGDCDDLDPQAWPGAPERCNRADDDCDGHADEGLSGACDEEIQGYDFDQDGITPAEGDCADLDPTVHPDQPDLCDARDEDCDGAIDEDAPAACDADADGWTAEQGDCNEAEPSIHPGAPEVCDPFDNDCDGALNNDLPGACRMDQDYDHDGVTIDEGDCDDWEPLVSPSLVEACDRLDNDCDRRVDEGLEEACHLDEDLDGDGFTYNGGNPGHPDDCNDLRPDVHVGAPELCDGLDNDCDRDADEGLPAGCVNDHDLDGDGSSVAEGDCDDLNPLAYPGNPEACDGFDTDCNGITDEFLDVDDDRYSLCGGDCHDRDASLGPLALEICNDLDDDCSGVIDDAPAQPWYQDADGDVHGSSGSSEVRAGCDHPGWALTPGDCDDRRPDVFPGAYESCDGEDDNCDGAIDEPFDQDRDGFTTCDTPGNPPDCRPDDPRINACFGSARFGYSTFPG